MINWGVRYPYQRKQDSTMRHTAKVYGRRHAAQPRSADTPDGTQHNRQPDDENETTVQWREQPAESRLSAADQAEKNQEEALASGEENPG